MSKKRKKRKPHAKTKKSLNDCYHRELWIKMSGSHNFQIIKFIQMCRVFNT